LTEQPQETEFDDQLSHR